MTLKRVRVFNPGRQSPLLALAGVLTPIWILGSAVVFGAFRPGYDANHAISELGQQGSANAVAWNIVGFGGAALLYALYSVAIAAVIGRSWVYRLTVLQALAIAGSSLFGCDPGCPPSMVTWQGWAHTVTGLTYFAATCVLPVVAWRTFRQNDDLRSLARVSLAAGILLIALFFAGPFLFGAEHVGIWQRTTLLMSGAWASAVALRLWTWLRRDQRTGTTARTSPAMARD